MLLQVVVKHLLLLAVRYVTMDIGLVVLRALHAHHQHTVQHVQLAVQPVQHVLLVIS